MPTINFSEPIDWNNEKALRKKIREECGVNPCVGISHKRNQIIDYMTGADLTTQLEFLKQTVTNEIVPYKKKC